MNPVAIHCLLRCFIISAEDEAVVSSLFLCDSEFCITIFLETVIVPIEMIVAEVGDHSNFRFEFVTIIELKAADLSHIIFCVLLRNLFCKTFSDVAYERCIQSCFLKNVMRERSCC